MAAHSPVGTDLMEFGLRVLRLLDEGKLESTYKLVAMLALVELCSETDPDDEAALEVSLFELARRIALIYRPCLEPFGQGDRLSQVHHNPKKSILTEVEHLHSFTDPDLQDLTNSDLRPLAKHIAQQPLTHLQSLPSSDAPDFIFDASWLHKKVNYAELEDRRWAIQMRPGAAYALAKLAPFIVPSIVDHWVKEVYRLNPQLARPSVGAYLLGLTDPTSTTANKPCEC